MNHAESTVIFPVGNAELRVPRGIVISKLLESLGSSPAGVPKIGEPWPGQGGINAGLMRGENGKPDYWLILPTDKAADLGELAWGSAGENEPGAQSEYDGLANTRALVESQHSHPAAEACAGLTVDGHSDLYLPARRENALLYTNLPELFEKCWHWSSTQYSAYYAWVQDFYDGFQGNRRKDDECRVRAVRMIPISD
ncbi:MAG TPA: DUF1566 domain-containing protein [Gammaproteobacteria bacterium]|nr:DUF1566 domain-containing protein [Gammaproteobacteria bacterium]